MAATKEKDWLGPLSGINEEDRKKERRRIFKNIIFITLGFSSTLMSFQGLTMLQSSLHLDRGMGVATQAILYGTFMLSCLFAPKLVIRMCGHKWTMTFMMIGYVIWVAANGYGVWWTMVPASIIVGLCAGPLWTSQSSYFTLEAGRYAALKNEEQKVVVSKFFGLFYSFFQLTAVLGAVVSATILKPQVINGTELTPSDEALQFCGANDCPDNVIANPNFKKQDPLLVWIMVGIYIAIGISGVVMSMVLVNQLPIHLTEQETKQKISEEIKSLLLATIYHMGTQKQLLLIPLTIYKGLWHQFLLADFSKSYVTCAIGIWNVGLVWIAYGLVNAVISYSVGHFVKYTGRIVIFMTGFLIHLASLIFLLFWKSNPDQYYLVYIFSAIWGISDVCWFTVLSSLYGSLFSTTPEEAFPCSKLCASIGYTVGFGYSSTICTSTKLYILIAVLTTGITGYVITEYLVHRENRKLQDPEVLSDMKLTASVGLEKELEPLKLES